MILGAFLALCAAGSLFGFLVRSSGRAATAVEMAAIAAALALALQLGSGGTVVLAGGDFSATSYAAAFLAVGLGSCLLLCLVTAASQPPTALAPAALAAFGGMGVALTAGDPRVSLVAGAAVAATGSATLLHHPDGDPRDGRLAEIRILGLVAGAFLLAALVVARPPWAGHEYRALGLAFLGLVLAVAIRSGVIPFHVPAAHLSRNATPGAPALLLVWLPAGLALLALTWSPIAFQADSEWLRGGIALAQVAAIATILLGGVAALVHDRVDEVASYSILSDAGLVLLALTARSEAAAEPARLWLLVFVAAKTGLVAWVAAATRAFGTAEIARMRGWLRRAPLLGLALIAIAIATLGWPGSSISQARADLIRLGLPDSLGWMGAASIVLAIAYYGRLLVVGLLRPTETVRESWSERPRLGFALRRRRERVEPTPEPGVQAAPAVEAAVEAAVEPASAMPSSPAGAPTATDDSVAAKPKRKRRTKAMAAGGSLPAITAEVPATADAAAPVELSGQTRDPSNQPSQPSSAETKPDVLVPPRRRRPRTTIRHRLGLLWKLNRTLEVSLVVLAAAVLSLLVAAGSFGSSSAARFGIPLGTAAHATPSPTASPTPRPTQGPISTGTPFITPPSARPSTLPSTVPSARPSGSVPPIKSAAPPTRIVQ